MFRASFFSWRRPVFAIELAINITDNHKHYCLLACSNQPAARDRSSDAHSDGRDHQGARTTTRFGSWNDPTPRGRRAFTPYGPSGEVSGSIHSGLSCYCMNTARLMKLYCTTSQMSIVELRRHKRAFLRLVTNLSLTKAPSAQTAQRMFVDFLSDQLSQS